MSIILDKLQALDWEQIAELLKQRNVQYGLLAGLVGVYVLRRMLRKPKYNLPPGPRGLPLVGNLMSESMPFLSVFARERDCFYWILCAAIMHYM